MFLLIFIHFSRHKFPPNPRFSLIMATLKPEVQRFVKNRESEPQVAMSTLGNTGARNIPRDVRFLGIRFTSVKTEHGMQEWQILAKLTKGRNYTSGWAQENIKLYDLQFCQTVLGKYRSLIAQPGNLDNRIHHGRSKITFFCQKGDKMIVDACCV